MTTRTAELQTLPIEQLRQSPTNPRKSFDDAAMQDLVASIKESGVHTPLLVRPLRSDGLPEIYEVVCGSRRLLAAKQAGLTEVPCLVREMDDAEASDAQVIENLQRADVHPAEEAEAYAAMIQAADGWYSPAGRYFAAASSLVDGKVAYVYHPRGDGAHSDPDRSNVVETFSYGTKKENLKLAAARAVELNAQPRELQKAGVDPTAEDIAKRVGKPTAYVAQRLKLLTLGLDAKLLFVRNHLTLGHALLLARLTEKDQGRALMWMLDADPKYVKRPLTEVIRGRLVARGEEKPQDEAEEEEVEFDSAGDRPSVPNVAKYMHEGRRLIDATEAQLKRWVEANVLLKLADVPWRLDDANLVAAAGACTNCPKRSGSNAALFGDLTAEDDVCLDPACYASKQDATVKWHKMEARKAGALLKISSKRSEEKLEQPAVERTNGSIAVTAKTVREGQWVKAEPGSCSATIQGLMVDGEAKGSIFAVCANQACKVHKHRVWSSSGGSSRNDEPRDTAAEAKRAALRELVDEVEPKVREAVFGAVVRKLASDPGRALRLVADEDREAAGTRKQLLEEFPKLDGNQLEALTIFVGQFRYSALDCNSFHIVNQKNGVGADRDWLWKLARNVGVDADAAAAKYFADAGGVPAGAEMLCPAVKVRIRKAAKKALSKKNVASLKARIAKAAKKAKKK